MKSKDKGSFLGRGWASPPVFVKGPNMALMNEGEVNINENLTNLLNTKLGERVFKPLYGTDLSQTMFQPQSSIPQGDLITFLEAWIERYEPRINVQEIDVEFNNEPESTLVVQISYEIIAINSRHNFVFPFYLNEGTHLALN